jgi:hypothetical protein
MEHTFTWYNQVPVAKGLVSNAEKHNAVDLIFRRADDKFDFVELKAPSRPSNKSHPLYAAMEVLKYGLAFLFFASHLEEIRQTPWAGRDEELLNDAAEINLCVLGPQSFYEGFDFAWLEEQLNESLRRLPDKPETKLREMSFHYQLLTTGESKVTVFGGSLLGLDRRWVSPPEWNVLHQKKASK